MYVNKLDKDGECAFYGRSAEESFLKIAKKKGCIVKRFGDNSEEQKKHSDILLNFNGKDIRIDVKAKKNVSRKEEDSSFPIWLEFKNVYGGDGWIYGGADFVAFEMSDHFILISRASLAEWAEKNIDLKEKAKDSKSAYKKAYTRFNRKDLISFVYRDDISQLIRRKWKKVI